MKARRFALLMLCAVSPWAALADEKAQDNSSTSGTSAAAAVVAAVSPPVLTFTQAPGRTSRNQIVTVTNSGAAPVKLGKIDIKGPNAAEFAREVSSTCVSELTVAPGASCELAINFTPTNGGQHEAMLLIPTSATGNPTVVKLTGVAM